MPFFIWIKVEKKEESIKTALGKAQYIQLVVTELKSGITQATEL